MSTDCDEKIARLHDRIDELVRELAENNRTILEFAAAAQESAQRAKRALDAVIQIGLRPVTSGPTEQQIETDYLERRHGR